MQAYPSSIVLVSAAVNPSSLPSPKAEVLLHLNQISFGYNATPILRDISLSVRRGQVVAIMGGSGSGKTTLLRLATGQLRPHSGTLTVLGESPSTLRRAALLALRKRLGVLFQQGALFTDLSVFENVAFALREHLQLPPPLLADLVHMKLHAVGLRGAAGLMPAALSGGMARRVALARAIALDPELMFYDEPFAGLDPISLGITAQLIRRLTDALDSAAVVITHDIHESLAIADYVYLLGEGRIAAEGTPAELRVSTHPFVRQFIDARPDGPVPFHYPAPPYLDSLGLGATGKRTAS